MSDTHRPHTLPPSRRPLHRALHAVLILCAVLLWTGCRGDSFFARRYENFTAYYNTFYNARKLYADGVKNVEQTTSQNIDRSVYVSVFAAPERVTNQQMFNDAIIKSADVLRESPGSKWVDDALLLIGKSYFYLGNYVGAEEKFQEVISTGSALEDESRFWLARTLIASNSYDEAINHLEFSLSIEGLSRRWESLLQLALGELHVRQQAWEEASLELERGLERPPDRDIGSRATFLLGQVLETLGRYDQAIEAYTRVLDYKPDYALAYAAQVSEIRVEAYHGDAERALRLVRAMERDDKNFENRAELMYLRGRTLQALALADQAYIVYDGLLYSEDRTLNASAVRGKVHYALGELYRDLYVDYTYAAAHFDTARAGLQPAARRQGTGGAAVQYAPEAITDAAVQADVFGSFADVNEQLVRLDSLLWLGEMDDEEFDAFILTLRERRAQELLEEQRLVERRQAEQQFQNMNSVIERSGKVLDAAAATIQGDANAGFLFYKDRIRLQEGRINFVTRWGDRPRVPNWRRLDAVNNTAQASVASDTTRSVENAIAAIVNEVVLPEIDYSDVPRTESRRVELQEQRAQVRYELANVLFLSMERPDSAAAWYRMVIEETGDLPVAQRAYYALAEVQRALGDTTSAQGLYARALELFPSNDFSERVRAQLGMPAGTITEMPDSSALAETAYDRAYTLWDTGIYDRAISEMLLAASTYPESEIAPRAYLAVGAMYFEWADRDTLDLYALPVPDLPDSLLAGFGFVDSLRIPEPTSAPVADSAATPAPDVPFQPVKARTLVSDTAVSDTSVSDTAVPDTLASGASATATRSLRAEADSAAVVLQDTMVTPASVAALPDTLASSVVPAQVNDAPARPLTQQERLAQIRPAWEAIRIDRLYTVLTERFPRTPYAEIATRRLKAIAELRPEEQVQQLVEEIEVQELIESLTPEERYMRGPEPIAVDSTGWVLVVGSFADQERARGVMNEYQEKGFRSDVYSAPTRFRVILGHFPSLDDARAGLETYKAEFPPNTWFMDLQNPR